MVLFHLLLGFAVAAAQEKGEGNAAAQEKSETNVVESAAPPEVGAFQPAPLDTIHLENAEGGLVPVSRASFEEYLRYRNQDLKSGRDSTYKILSLEGTGQATGNRVDLSVTLRILLDSERDEWIRIPLGFQQAAFRALPKDAEGEHRRIEFESLESDDITANTRRRYVLWLRGGAGEDEQTVTLEFSVPLSGIGRESRLLLSVPPALKSTLTLTVPMAEVVAKAPDEVELTQKAKPADEKAENKNATELTLSGFQGEIDLRWGKPNGSAAVAAPVLTSAGMITASVAPHDVFYEAKLTVRVDRPSGPAVTGFEVRLPPGAVLSDEKSSNYTITDVTPADQNPQEGRLVEVVFQEPLGDSESETVTLHATSTAAPPASGMFPLAGFDVLGAVQQTGVVEVCVRGDWDVRCELGRGVTPASPVSVEQDRQDLVGRYRYGQQPFSLAARVFPKQVRIRVEPRYELSLESDVAKLAANLKYSVRGDKAYQLKIDLNGWEFDRVGPEERVVSEACGLDDTGVLVIRLREGLLNEFDLLLSAHRAIGPAERSLKLLMPKPQATTLSSIALAVFPADNIELREEKAVGLERQTGPLPTWLKPRETQQEPLCYLGQTDETVEASFAAVTNIRQREMSAELSTEVSLTAETPLTLAPTKASVRGRLVYDVKYEPISSLSIRIPADLIVEYSLDGRTVSAVGGDESSAVEGLVSRKIVLPSPRQGRIELIADYSVPIGELAPLTSVTCAIPLIVPEDATFTGHRLRATVESGIGIWRARGGAWQEVSNRASYDAGTITEFTADTPEHRIVLGVHPMDPSVTVDAAWLQTVMNGSQRSDRAVYRFTSNRKDLIVKLPSGADTDRLEVRLDGRVLRREVQEYSVSSDPSISVKLKLPGQEAPHERVLDVRFFSDSCPPRGRMQLELPGLRLKLPGLGNDVRIRRCYWQLVLRGDEHVLSAPKDYTAEYKWDWNGLWWGRVPIMEQADLEQWTRAGSERPVPNPKGTSRYLFSTFGPAQSVELVTASRTWIVGAASGLALLIGLVVIYIPVTRHPLFGLILVIAILGTAVVWPGVSLLAAQAAGMGMVLSLLGAILYRGVARRRRRTIRRDMASSVSERGSAQVLFGSSEVEIVRTPASEPNAAAVQTPEG